MVKIDFTALSRIEKNKVSIHEEVKATYSIFYHNNAKYFQIDTYGREDRSNPDKISQSFQLDEESADILIAMLKKVFKL